MSYSIIGRQRCYLCHAPTERSCDMCKACGKSYDKYAFDDASIMAAILWAADRAWRQRRKHARAGKAPAKLRRSPRVASAALVPALQFVSGGEPTVDALKRYSPQGYRAENDLDAAERVLKAINMLGYAVVRAGKGKRNG